MVDVVLVHLINFTSNKFYVYLLNVEPSNLVFFKTFNTEFQEMVDKNGRTLI